jgi:hypothetical protein
MFFKVRAITRFGSFPSGAQRMNLQRHHPREQAITNRKFCEAGRRARVPIYRPMEAKREFFLKTSRLAHQRASKKTVRVLTLIGSLEYFKKQRIEQK